LILQQGEFMVERGCGVGEAKQKKVQTAVAILWWGEPGAADNGFKSILEHSSFQSWRSGFLGSRGLGSPQLPEARRNSRFALGLLPMPMYYM
jgi:hypothetical protein